MLYGSSDELAGSRDASLRGRGRLPVRRLRPWSWMGSNGCTGKIAPSPAAGMSVPGITGEASVVATGLGTAYRAVANPGASGRFRLAGEMVTSLSPPVYGYSRRNGF